MLSMNDLTPLHGRRSAVVTEQGDKVGSLGEVYLSDVTEDPTWITVHTGLFGTKESFVPLHGATVQGGHVVVAYPRDLIRRAPSTERDGQLGPGDENGLYQHYDLVDPAAPAQQDASTNEQSSIGQVAPAGQVAAVSPAQPEVPVGHDESITADVPVSPDVPVRSDEPVARDETLGGLVADGADSGKRWMIRSEERLRVGTEQYEAARVRLRKYVVTEEETKAVPLRRDELRVEREPIGPGTLDFVPDDSLFQEDSVEMVGHEEVAVVRKETVAVERVRLNKATITGRTTVREQVRKERIESSVEGETAGGTRKGRRSSATGRASGKTSAGHDDEDRSSRVATNSPNALIKGKKKRR
ncbi:DUF2382 domain-containing protein [Arthrobacter cheniae]|uniref:DUF2382 domain-containing protein n=1 Tax=Arthrobacter cheniae TaxID=1258888 RepID=A0A3A5M448_9MICC|nr:DUF2382 domain-containing protein [Arthrobacter cheniae]RJT80019.1 DUF2382 domain-containing protein [Arthrobacter cheniae]